MKSPAQTRVIVGWVVVSVVKARVLWLSDRLGADADRPRGSS
jgi:hypothetical protein